MKPSEFLKPEIIEFLEINGWTKTFPDDNDPPSFYRGYEQSMQTWTWFSDDSSLRYEMFIHWWAGDGKSHCELYFSDYESITFSLRNIRSMLKRYAYAT